MVNESYFRFADDDMMKWYYFALFRKHNRIMFYIISLCISDYIGFVLHIPESLDKQLWWYNHINGLVQDCSISIGNALEVLQSCTKSPPSSGSAIHQPSLAERVFGVE